MIVLKSRPDNRHCSFSDSPATAISGRVANKLAVADRQAAFTIQPAAIVCPIMGKIAFVYRQITSGVHAAAFFLRLVMPQLHPRQHQVAKGANARPPAGCRPILHG